MTETVLGWWGIPLAILGGAITASTPYIYVSLGECLTEKSGRINLGLEGNLVLGAMTAYAASYSSGSPWLGVFAAGISGVLLGLLHAWICSHKKVNDIAVGIAMMLFGIGIAFFLGKPYIQPTAPHLPAIGLGVWSDIPQVQAALQVNILFLLGLLLAPLLKWGLSSTRWGLMVRTVGDSQDAAEALGFPVNAVRAVATMIGGFLAGVGGSVLSLYYPGSWNEGLSSGQGLIAVALVVFAKWQPMRCLFAAMLFGGASALGPALQSVGISGGYYLFNAAPYVLTLILMLATCSRQRTLTGVPGELSITK
ncbi:MAG: ABC transporter permease [Methylococcaceae bacterium]|jgi:simple sugar transport system permease protein